VNRSRTSVVFTNQIREKIGVMFGNPETTTGGRALKFYASLRMDIRRIGAIKDGQELVGNRTRVKVVKNKMAPPFRQAEFDIMYDEGISHTGLLIDLGSELGIVDKSGCLVLVRRDAAGPGSGEREGVPEGEPGDGGGDRGEGPVGAGHEPEPGGVGRTRRRVADSSAQGPGV
jgi:protein RecA